MKNEIELQGIDHMSIPDWKKMTQEYEPKKKIFRPN